MKIYISVFSWNSRSAKWDWLSIWLQLAGPEKGLPQLVDVWVSRTPQPSWNQTERCSVYPIHTSLQLSEFPSPYLEYQVPSWSKWFSLKCHKEKEKIMKDMKQNEPFTNLLHNKVKLITSHIFRISNKEINTVLL